jgi:hypothetical protein
MGGIVYNEAGTESVPSASADESKSRHELEELATDEHRFTQI